MIRVAIYLVMQYIILFMISFIDLSKPFFLFLTISNLKKVYICFALLRPTQFSNPRIATAIRHEHQVSIN